MFKHIVSYMSEQVMIQWSCSWSRVPPSSPGVAPCPSLLREIQARSLLDSAWDTLVALARTWWFLHMRFYTCLRRRCPTTVHGMSSKTSEGGSMGKAWWRCNPGTMASRVPFR